jgi:hypothetical protein
MSSPEPSSALAELLPAAQFTPEQIEQVLSGLAEKGIYLVES